MTWSPSALATHIEAVAPTETKAGSLLVEHFNDPYETAIADHSEKSLHGAAYAYLKALTQHPALAVHRKFVPEHWIAALDPERDGSQEPYFGWMPFERAAADGDRAFSGPYGCLRFSSPSDDIAVVYAAERLGPDRYIGSGFGLAVAMHLRQDRDGLWASFTGLSATLPFGVFARHPISGSSGDVLRPYLSLDRLFHDAAVLGTMASEAGLEGVAVRGVRMAASPDQVWIQRRGTGVRIIDGIPVPHAVSMWSVGGKDGFPTGDRPLRVTPLFADAANAARVFERDPSSFEGLPVRPLRGDLDKFRVARTIVTGGSGGAGLEIAGSAAQPLVQVMLCRRFVQADDAVPAATLPGETRHITIAAGGPAVRSDDAAALQAFFHADDLVKRLKAYGWTDPTAYFRVTAPAIKIYYRSGISPGPGKDGRTVNARVIPEGWPADAIGRTGPDSTPPAIQIHLASADLRRRDPQPAATDGTVAPPATLGIAADRRWMWHEFGHVLLLASTGELEFRFAHSAGDAMAAIVADPDSNLTGRLRGSTFPFVFLPRRHDRCAGHGWSWSGTMHAALKEVPDALHPRRKGYDSEQILSSSLFRLYRAIGGDTLGEAPGELMERRRASHYGLYLIMQAMQMMGDARLQVTSTPAQFVHWLRQADRQTGVWSATIDGTTFSRVGGTLSKVIRWAFEAQGLYGAGNGPGQPEQVDIYIADRRGTNDPAYGDDDYGPGSYVPTSLHWQSSQMQAASGAAPLWQADPDEGIIFFAEQGRVEVRVRNRGLSAAAGVVVRLWFAGWPLRTSAPLFEAAQWSECAPTPSNGPPASSAGFEAVIFDFKGQAPGRYILVAAASCPDDRANTDLALSLACSYHPAPLADLVANDNNLGLRVVTL